MTTAATLNHALERTDPILIVFDVDGTLIEGEEHDWAAFDAALTAEFDFVRSPDFYTALGDVTAETIIAAVAKECGRVIDEAARSRICDQYLAGLKEAHAFDSGAFCARGEAKDLLVHLRSLPGVALAIATGDWQPTICFKFQCAGIDISGLPMATSSDAVRRSDIIRLAVERARGELSRTLYVGDGHWDLHACRELGIPLIATGARVRSLVESGAMHFCEEMSVSSFLPVMQKALGSDRARQTTRAD